MLLSPKLPSRPNTALQGTLRDKAAQPPLSFDVRGMRYS